MAVKSEVARRTDMMDCHIPSAAHNATITGPKCRRRQSIKAIRADGGLSQERVPANNAQTDQKTLSAFSVAAVNPRFMAVEDEDVVQWTKDCSPGPSYVCRHASFVYY
ncbi:hypothetical protein F2P81_006079 [Scophthalmus maximus]|uniref:Uncharacterized protein n=1 Tax=Scophthalmus maximus TaxID=52904 RepID=A0A6A4T894_SCOMX|nr:hypothetical protein F2P81_006079 [Scophthalmus maximus]